MKYATLVLSAMLYAGQIQVSAALHTWQVFAFGVLDPPNSLRIRHWNMKHRLAHPWMESDSLPFIPPRLDYGAKPGERKPVSLAICVLASEVPLPTIEETKFCET